MGQVDETDVLPIVLRRQVMAQVRFTVGPTCLQTHYVVIFPVLEHIIRTDIYKNRKNQYNGSPTLGMRTKMVGKIM